MPSDHDVFLTAIPRPSKESIYNRRDLIELSNSRTSEDRFWHQDIVLRTVQNNNIEEGYLFYHGMGTGKTCLYSKYIRQTILHNRYFRRIHIVVKRKLQNIAKKSLEEELCGIPNNAEIRNITYHTYKEFGSLGVPLFNELVIIDEAHGVLKTNTAGILDEEDGKGDSATFTKHQNKSTHQDFENIMGLLHKSIHTVVLLFDGTPIQNHEVDLVNMIRLTNKDFNTYVTTKGQIKDIEYLDASTFEERWNTQEDVEELVKRIGKRTSYIQVPTEIARNFKRNETFCLKYNGSIIFSDEDFRSFGNLYLSKANKTHLQTFKEMIGPLSESMRQSLLSSIFAISTKSEQCKDTDIEIQLNSSSISAVQGMVRANQHYESFKCELCYDEKKMFNELSLMNDTEKKMEVIKNYSPIMWSTMKNILHIDGNGLGSGVCIIYSSYKTGIFDTSGTVSRLLSAFGYVNLRKCESNNEVHEYKRYLYLNEPHDFELIDTHVNVEENVMGKLAKIIFITPQGKEGFSIFNCQQIHVLCPDSGLFFKTDQAISRGVRLGRHEQLKKYLQTQHNIKFEEKVDVYLHALIFEDEEKVYFPNQLRMYIKMFSQDLRMKSFERMCLQDSFDCRYMRSLNENQQISDNLRVCHYTSCQLYCNEKVVNTSVLLHHQLTSFYDFNRKNLEIVKGWILGQLLMKKYVCIGYEVDKQIRTISADNYTLFKTTMIHATRELNKQVISLGHRTCVIHYIKDIDCLTLIPTNVNAQWFSYLSKDISGVIMPLMRSSEIDQTQPKKKNTKQTVVSQYSNRVVYKVPLPFTWNMLVSYLRKINNAIRKMIEVYDDSQGPDDENPSAESMKLLWFLIKTKSDVIKIKQIYQGEQWLYVKMGGTNRIVTDLYTYIIKKCMTFSSCMVHYEDQDLIYSTIDDFLSQLPDKGTHFRQFTHVTDFAQTDFAQIDRNTWIEMIMNQVSTYLANYIEIKRVKETLQKITKNLQLSDKNNNQDTVNEPLLLSVILYFMSIGNHPSTSAKITEQNMASLQYVPEPLRALMASIVFECGALTQIFTKKDYFVAVMNTINTKMISLHIENVPDDQLPCIYANVCKLEMKGEIVYDDIKELFNVDKYEYENPPSTTREKVQFEKREVVQFKMHYLDAVHDLFSNYAMVYRYFKTQEIGMLTGTVCKNKDHIPKLNLHNISRIHACKKCKKLQKQTCSCDMSCDELWNTLKVLNDPRAIEQEDFPL